jgi:acetate kinase
LGRAPTVAALLNGVMIESSLGFPPVDNIPSATGCGEVDPAALLELSAAHDPAVVERQLATQAGWAALAGRPLDWDDLLAAANPAARLANEMTRRSLLKWIGAALTALPCVPSFLFALEDPHPALPWIQSLLAPLSFTGLTLAAPVSEADGWRLSPSGAAPSVWVLSYDRVQHLADLLTG